MRVSLGQEIDCTAGLVTVHVEATIMDDGTSAIDEDLYVAMTKTLARLSDGVRRDQKEQVMGGALKEDRGPRT